MALSDPAQTTPLPLASSQVVRELCSGVDALDLSGRAELSTSLVEMLEELRQAAEAASEPQSLSLAGVQFFVEPRSFGKYRYRLAHPSGLFGVTTSEKLPSFYVQPYAEYLHGVGPRAAFGFFDQMGPR